jgi:hypothetical protein
MIVIFTLLLLKGVCKLLKFDKDSLEIRFSEMCVSYYKCGAKKMNTSDFGGSLFFINK